MAQQFVIFKKTAQSKQSPNGRKIAQSGHPACDEKSMRNFLLKLETFGRNVSKAQ
jgi:hypothetical protein